MMYVHIYILLSIEYLELPYSPRSIFHKPLNLIIVRMATALYLASQMLYIQPTTNPLFNFVLKTSTAEKAAG